MIAILTVLHALLVRAANRETLSISPLSDLNLFVVIRASNFYIDDPGKIAFMERDTKMYNRTYLNVSDLESCIIADKMGSCGNGYSFMLEPAGHGEYRIISKIKCEKQCLERIDGKFLTMKPCSYCSNKQVWIINNENIVKVRSNSNNVPLIEQICKDENGTKTDCPCNGIRSNGDQSCFRANNDLVITPTLNNAYGDDNCNIVRKTLFVRVKSPNYKAVEDLKRLEDLRFNTNFYGEAASRNNNFNRYYEKKDKKKVYVPEFDDIPLVTEDGGDEQIVEDSAAENEKALRKLAAEEAQKDTYETVGNEIKACSSSLSAAAESLGAFNTTLNVARAASSKVSGGLHENALKMLERDAADRNVQRIDSSAGSLKDAGISIKEAGNELKNAAKRIKNMKNSTKDDDEEKINSMDEYIKNNEKSKLIDAAEALDIAGESLKKAGKQLENLGKSPEYINDSIKETIFYMFNAGIKMVEAGKFISESEKCLEAAGSALEASGNLIISASKAIDNSLSSFRVALENAAKSLESAGDLFKVICTVKPENETKNIPVPVSTPNIIIPDKILNNPMVSNSFAPALKGQYLGSVLSHPSPVDENGELINLPRLGSAELKENEPVVISPLLPNYSEAPPGFNVVVTPKTRDSIMSSPSNLPNITPMILENDRKKIADPVRLMLNAVNNMNNAEITNNLLQAQAEANINGAASVLDQAKVNFNNSLMADAEINSNEQMNFGGILDNFDAIANARERVLASARDLDVARANYNAMADSYNNAKQIEDLAEANRIFEQAQINAML